VSDFESFSYVEEWKASSRWGTESIMGVVKAMVLAALRPRQEGV